MTTPPFHLTLGVDDLDRARRFYGTLLECPIRHEADQWIDFDFFGHRISAHLDSDGVARSGSGADGKAGPLRRFGVTLSSDRWAALAARISDHGLDFLGEPAFTREGG